jgi:hypothetical protein
VSLLGKNQSDIPRDYGNTRQQTVQEIDFKDRCPFLILGQNAVQRDYPVKGISSDGTSTDCLNSKSLSETSAMSMYVSVCNV